MHTPCIQPELYFNQCSGKNIAFLQMQVNSVVDYHISKTLCLINLGNFIHIVMFTFQCVDGTINRIKYVKRFSDEFIHYVHIIMK